MSLSPMRLSIAPVLAAVFLLSGVTCPAQGPRRGGGMYGDWLLSVAYEGRTMESILAFSRDAEGNRTASWISFWGTTDVEDLQLDEGAVSFAWSRERSNGETRTSTFAGRIAEDSLTGTLSSERGEFEVTGERVPRSPRAVGDWDLKFRIGEMDIETVLKVRSPDGTALAGEWVSQWGEHRITEIVVEENQLRFKRTSTFEDRTFESSFSGTLSREGLSGTMSSDMGDVSVAGTRREHAAVGTWNLELESERGTRSQRLRIDRDLSAWFGPRKVDEVTVEGNEVSFPMHLTFGDQSMDLFFSATLDGEGMTGELTSPRGASTVTGAKVARGQRRRGS